MPDYREITLNNLNNGAVPELFDEAWEKLLDNIADPNTDNDKVRELTIKIKVKPSEKRTGAAVVGVKVEAKLPGKKMNAGAMILDIDRDTKKMRAYNIDPRQPEFPAIVDMETEKMKKAQGDSK